MQILRSADVHSREFRCYAIGEGVDVNTFVQNATNCITQANYVGVPVFDAKDREFRDVYGIPASRLLLDLLYGVYDPQKLPNEVKYVELQQLEGGAVILSATYVTASQRHIAITILDLSQYDNKADQQTSINIAPESPHDIGPSIDLKMSNQGKIQIL